VDAVQDQVAVADVRAAAERLRGRVVRTPLVPFPMAETDRPLWLKAESSQPTGAFKRRGAYNAMSAEVVAQHLGVSRATVYADAK
jgi:threonine dehydratase